MTATTQHIIRCQSKASAQTSARRQEQTDRWQETGKLDKPEKSGRYKNLRLIADINNFEFGIEVQVTWRAKMAMESCVIG